MEQTTADLAAAGSASRRWYRRITLSLSAFIMSVTMAAINAFYALQGSELLVQPPQSILLYRDGEGAASVLSVAVRLPMINTTADHGDLLLGARIEPRRGGPSLNYVALADPVLVPNAKEAVGKCSLGVRCLPYEGLLVMERPEEVIDIAGGAAKSPHMVFTAAEWNCKGGGAACKGYADFNAAFQTIATTPLDLRITLKFHRDGERVIHCKGPKPQAEFLAKYGWLTVACENSKVEGERLL